MKYVGDTIVIPERAEDGSGFRIPIPSYHRAAVGIFPGTKLFLVPIPKTHDLIVTPIDPKTWGDLWRLEASLKDEPGAARSIVHTLVENQINILIQEGLSDYSYRGGLAHRVLLVLDLAKYHSVPDGDTHVRNTVEKPSLVPNRLLNNILTQSLDFMNLTPAEDSWDFSFKRMEFFYRNKEHRTRFEQTHLTAKSVTVPARLVHMDLFDRRVPSTLACHVISDSEEKYIKIRFLEETTPYILVRIEHRERVGAILSFMNVLKAKDANIINSYSRLTAMNQRAFWYAFSELNPKKAAASDVDELMNALNDIDDVEAFSVLSAYGFHFDVAAYVNQLGLSKYHVPARPSPRGVQPAPPIETGREAAEQRLGVRPFYAGKQWDFRKDDVFVAMPFDQQYDSFYDEWIKGTIEGEGLRAVRMDKFPFEDPNETVMAIVRQCIATCRFVVADVSDFNPNVIYEVGLAHAIGKRVLLLCQDKHKQEKRIMFDLNQHRHLFYSPFKIQSFVTELRNQIRTMKEGANGIGTAAAGSRQS